MSSATDKQLKLGQKKKVPKPKITERTELDFNSWVLPDDVDLIKEAIEICGIHTKAGINTFYLNQNKMQWDFAFDDGTLLFTNHPCPGCGKKHNASIDLETAETTQHCNTVNAIFMNTSGKKAVQVKMICPTCEKMGITVDYPTWKTLSDKDCASCQQETAAAKEEKRKKSKKLSKEGETTAPQTPETSIEEVAEAIEELVPEKEQEYITITCAHCGFQDAFWEKDNTESSGLLCDGCGKTIPNPNLETVESKKSKKKPKKEKKETVSLKQDNGTREGLPETFNKETDKIIPRGIKSEQINLDQFCTMLINTNKIVETDFQFREKLDSEHIKLLSSSIKAFGKNIEAILVRQIDEGKYEIISGHHRVAAAKKAKVNFVKCEVIDATDKESLEISITTNFTHKTMNPLEESRAIKKYHDLSPELNQDDIAKKFGKSQPWISSRLSLLEAPKFAQQKLAEEKITASHVEAVKGLPQGDQESIITDAARQNLSVRDTEKLVKEKKRKQKMREELEAAYADLELHLNDHLDELKEKRISSTEIWNADDETIAKYYDMTVDNILEELSLNEYEKPLYNWEYGETREKVLGIFTNVGLELVDGSDLHDDAEEVETEIKKKENLCEDCDVKKEYFDIAYCPFSADLSKPKTKCKYVWECGDDGKTFPEEAKTYCFICSKEFTEDDFTRRRDAYGRRVHMSCYHELLVQQGFINFVACEETPCKRKGSCPQQDNLLSAIHELAYPIVIDLTECEHHKAEDEEDKFTLTKPAYYHYLSDDYGTSTEVGHTIEEVAEFIKEKEIPIDMLTAVGEVNTSHLNQLLELLKEDKDSSEKEESN